MHFGGGPLLYEKVVAASFQFMEQVAVFVRGSGVAVGDTAVIVGGTMLADVLVGVAIVAVVVGGQFGEEGEEAPSSRFGLCGK